MLITACDRCGVKLPRNHRTDRLVHREQTPEQTIEVLLYAQTRIKEEGLFHVRFSELCLDCMKVMLHEAVAMIEAEQDHSLS